MRVVYHSGVILTNPPEQEPPMNRQNHTHADSKVKDACRFVDFLLGLSNKGWTKAQILEKHPQLTPSLLRAAFAFEAEIAREENLRAVWRIYGAGGAS